MKKSLVLFFSTIFVGISVLSVGCGSGQNDHSQTNSIATDLPDDGSKLPIYLYWLSGASINRGLCQADGPILKSNCTQDVESMRYSTFKVKLDAGLSQTIIDLRSEVASILVSLEAVESQMRTTILAIEENEIELGAANAELVSARVEIKKVKIFVDEYRYQLALIDQAIRRITDNDLIIQRDVVAKELDAYRGKIFVLQGEIYTLVTQITSLHITISSLERALERLTIRFSNLKDELGDTILQLESARDDFSVYENTLEKLESNIIYRVLSDQTLYRKNRKFVKRFENIFAK